MDSAIDVSACSCLILTSLIESECKYLGEMDHFWTQITVPVGKLKKKLDFYKNMNYVCFILFFKEKVWMGSKKLKTPIPIGVYEL